MKLNSAILIFIALSCIDTKFVNARTCFSCKGINCLRVLKTETTKCQDPIDNCVTIFEGFQVVARGCFSEIESNLRKKCSNPDSQECDQCSKDSCNIFGRNDFKCIQCDSSKDINCKNNISQLQPQRCPVSTSTNSYCYSKVIENGVVIRGCSGNTLAQNQCLADEKCILCLSGDMENCNKVKMSENDDGPITSEKPPISSEKPPISSEKPPISSEKPPISSEKPPISSEKPPISTEKPDGGGAVSISITTVLLVLPFLIQIVLVSWHKLDA